MNPPRTYPIDLTDDMVVAAMAHVPGCDHDDMVTAVEAALALAAPVYRAAPDLLEALKGCVEYRNWQIAEGGVVPLRLRATFKNAEAAIARAEQPS